MPPAEVGFCSYEHGASIPAGRDALLAACHAAASGAKLQLAEGEKLLLGFANGWADNEKFIRVEPEDAARAVEAAHLRGAMYWVIDEEGSPYDFAGRYTGALPAGGSAELR